MRKTLRSLLSEIIDFAGLFPPAQLPLEEAWRTYVRHLATSPQRWMLGRFVCPLTQLPDLLKLARVHPENARPKLTVLGQTAAHADEFDRAIASHIEAIQDFRRACGKNTVIDMLELALPRDVALTSLSGAIANFRSRADEANLGTFLEVPRSPTWLDDVETLIQLLQESKSSEEAPRLGIKLRTGGVKADAFPSDAEVAAFIDRVSTARLPWKATAGLHHPRRFWDNDLQVWHHGFLNVFVAGILAATNPMPETDLVEIIAERNPRHFHFEDEDLTWRIWSCRLDQIEELRRTRVTTFGCCSFDEPCQDLTDMGLLDGRKA